MNLPWTTHARGRRLVAGRYEIGPELGRGSVGRVVRAWDRRCGRPVALKLLHRELEGDATALARLEREVRALARLSHPHVVAVLGMGRSPGAPSHIAMELLEGEPLSAILAREGRLAPDRAARLGLMAARALAAAHAEGILHRDVKPGNLVLTRGPGGDEVVKLVDFGLARLTGLSGEPTTLTRDRVVGTPYYVAPEQARGEAATPLSDLYGLGAVLYHALTGRPPFDGQSAMSVLYHHVHTPLQPLDDLAPDAPAWLVDLVHALLAKAAEARPAGAAEVVARLRRALGDAADTAPMLTVVPEATPGRRRVGSLVLAACASLALAPVLLSGSVPPTDEPTARNAPASIDRARGAEGDRAYVTEAATEGGAVDPEGPTTRREAEALTGPRPAPSDPDAIDAIVADEGPEVPEAVPTPITLAATDAAEVVATQVPARSRATSARARQGATRRSSPARSPAAGDRRDATAEPAAASRPPPAFPTVAPLNSHRFAEDPP